MESDLGKLFIGGISWDTDENRLREYFGHYGEIVEAVIMRDRVTGRARGFGFVVFADPSAAERVVMEKHVIDGRTVEAKKAVPREDHQLLNRNSNSIQGSPGPGRTRKIFVGGLASSVTETDFKGYFEQFGRTTDVVVMYDHNTQRPRGFGFITFETEDAVDKVLQKTFHELNGKLVEVKRAVPKELSPGPSRSPFPGFNYGMGRASNFINNYGQGYNVNNIGGYGRFSPLASSRAGFPPFGTTGYGMGMNMEQGLGSTYGGNSAFNASPSYGRLLNPYLTGNSNRFGTAIGYGGGNMRNDSLLSPNTRSVWGNGSFSNPANPNPAAAFLGSGSGTFGTSFGNAGTNWGSSPVTSQGAGGASGYAGGNLGYGFGEGNYGLGGGGGGGYGRTSGNTAAPASSFAASSGGLDSSYGELFRSGSVYGNSTWRSPSELEETGSFGFGLGNASSDVTAKTSEGYIGGYNATNRQQFRGIAA